MHLEIWSDIACPWCYVGKRRMESALAQFEHGDDVHVHWRAFELDPSAPPERRGDYVTGLARKYGRTEEEARHMLAEMTQMAAAEGLDYRLEQLRPGNTFDGHRLVRMAADHGEADAMVERLMHAYLNEGRLISDHETLVDLGEEVGLPRAGVGAMLASGRYTEEVRAEEELARGFGISAVPFFVVDRSMGAAGAQEPAVLAEMLREGWRRTAA